MLSIILATLVTVLTATAYADEIYPTPVPVRYSGHHQGNTGSCMAEAQVGALEHAFAARHYTVKLSAAYNHAFNWNGKTGQDINQDYTGGDGGIFSRYGAIVPYYLLPEDGRGFDAYNSGNRPSVSTILTEVTGFPAAHSVGYSATYYSFQPGWSNSMRDLNTIKAWVSQRQALTLSIHSEIMRFMDDDTGLLRDAYSFSALTTRNGGKKTSHAVAVVGYDDSLYADKGFSTAGALIVRNSWIENYGLARIQQPMDLSNPELVKMKAKISRSFVEPGYYALPYQYVIDMMNQSWPGEDRQGTAGINFLNVDYTTYAAYYFEHESKYEVRRIPFACSLDGIKAKLNRYKIFNKQRRSPERGISEMSNREWRKILEQQRNQPWSAIFQTALVSRAKNGSIDRFRDFESGAYNNYYCPNGGTTALPGELINNVKFDQLVDGITADVNSLSAWIKFYDYMIEALKI